ncbi:MAG: hypothetical protein H0W07_00075 [Chloroflexi bacterium]|nr:hypothetical protein [Chloroflexota bacterium]
MPDPPGLVMLLEGYGFQVAPGVEGMDIALGDDMLSIRTAVAAPFAVDPCRPVPGRAQARPEGRLAAIGLATVDHQRFAGDHGLRSLDPGPHDDLLGARSWRWTGGDRLVLLEPSTEGRLAGALARLGEGALVIYLSPGAAARIEGGRATALSAPGIVLGPPSLRAAMMVVL